MNCRILALSRTVRSLCACERCLLPARKPSWGIGSKLPNHCTPRSLPFSASAVASTLGQ
jgi:hypothetical protein